MYPWLNRIHVGTLSVHVPVLNCTTDMRPNSLRLRNWMINMCMLHPDVITTRDRTEAYTANVRGKVGSYALREIQYINFAFIINVSQSVPILPSPFATSKKHKIKSKANACIQGIMNPSSCAVCIFPRVGKGYSFFFGGDGF